MKPIKLLFFLPLFSFCIVSGINAQEEPPGWRDAFRNVPEGFLLGMGKGKAETNWESMLFAECRAFEDIAFQLSTLISDMRRDYAREDGRKVEEDITISVTEALLRNCKIVYLTKTEDGTWWCQIWLPKANTFITL
jgi:hypothetical protein